MIIRYSMLKAWLDCPKAFYDRYVLGKIDSKKSSALEFGTAIHLGIRNILDGEDGVESFRMYWNSLKDANMQYYGQSWGELNDIAKDVMLPNFKRLHSKKFTEFRQEVEMTMPFQEHTLQGTADYIGLYEGKLTIADWKTASKNYNSNKLELNPQLYIYAKLCKETQGTLPTQLMYKVFNKKTGSIQTLKKPLTEQYMNDIYSHIQNVTHAMLYSIENKQLWHGSDCYCKEL